MDANEKRKYLSQLFKEAYEAVNMKKLDLAKKKFDEVLELSKEEFPEIYFEACFRLGDIFFEQDNYRGCVECALMAIKHAPTQELYLVGINRLRDILYILKQQGVLNVLAGDMEGTLSLLKGNRELYAFARALMEIAKGHRTVAGLTEEIKTKELKEVVESLL